MGLSGSNQQHKDGITRVNPTETTLDATTDGTDLSFTGADIDRLF